MIKNTEGFFHEVHNDATGRRRTLTRPRPLRTVRESFPSHGSSLSKDILVAGCPTGR